MGHWEIWVVVGFVSFVAEIFAPGFFFASLGLGAFAAAVPCYLGSNFSTQIFVLSAGTLAAFVSARLLFTGTGKSTLRTNVDALIGQEATVLELIDGDSPGQVKVGGEQWRARCISGLSYVPGTRVRVARISGNTLYVTQQEDL